MAFRVFRIVSRKGENQEKAFNLNEKETTYRGGDGEEINFRRRGDGEEINFRRRGDREEINRGDRINIFTSCEFWMVALATAIFAPFCSGFLSFVIFWIILEGILFFFFCTKSGWSTYNRSTQQDCKEEEYYCVSERITQFVFSAAIWWVVQMIFLHL